MPIKFGSIFLTPKPENSNEAQLAAFPDPVVANIIEDESGQVTSVDRVFWRYDVVPPPESQLPSFQPSPAPEQVVLEIRFAPDNTPFPSSTTSSTEASATSMIAADNAAYSSNGAVPIAANEPREDSALLPSGQPESLETEDGFEIQIREYKYNVILTTPQIVYMLDPTLMIRRRHRILQQ